MTLVDPTAIVPLPPEVTTRAMLFEYLAFEELQRVHPEYELFVFASRQIPGNPFAIVFKMHHDTVAAKGWPPFVCPVKRWATVTADIVADTPLPKL